MSNPPVNFGVPPPDMNMPPPAIPAQPTLQVQPTYAPHSVYPDYSHSSYNHSDYSSSFPYYPQYRQMNVPPPTTSVYPTIATPAFVPPGPSTTPHSYSYYNKQYNSPLTEETVEQYLRNWNTVPLKTIKTDKLCRTTSLSESERNPNSLNTWTSLKNENGGRDRELGRLSEHSRRREHSRDRERELFTEQDRRRECSRHRQNDRAWEHSRDKERIPERDRRYSVQRSRSPSYSSHRYRSPSRSEVERRFRDRKHDRYVEREREKERYLDEKRDYDRKRRQYEKCRSPPNFRDDRSQSRSSDYRRRLRSPSRISHSSKDRPESVSRIREGRESSNIPRDIPRKPLTDREKILEEYSKNYCRTSEDLTAKMEQWYKQHQSEEEEASKLWYRCSPAELYYKRVEGQPGVEQTKKLNKLVDTFFSTLIERGRNARPVVDELPPLVARRRMCSKHNHDDKSSSSTSSEESDIDEEGLQGYTDRIMLELERKQSHPRRLHPEMWFNNPGEMNGGPLCRCSVRARRFGMRHGVYAGEQEFPKCVPTHSNVDKLFHYRITVSPPTNFLIKNPTIIGHDEHEFLFSGFSMFSHYKLAKLPTCKVIRFNIEYTILYVEEPAPDNFTVQELDYFEEFLFTEILELVDLDLGKATETSCSQFHFMPRFVRLLAEGGCEILSMCEVMKYMIDESGLLIDPKKLNDMHDMDHYDWQKFVDRIKGMIVTYPGKKPCSVRVDQLDRSPPLNTEGTPKETNGKFYPEIVHFGIRPPQLSYAGNPEYQKAWRYYVKYRHLIANMAKPTYKERMKLAAKEAKLQEMRTQSKMKRDVTVAMSSEGFHTTGLMCDVVQHAMLIPVLVRHLRFHKSLEALEKKIGYEFQQRLLLQTALTHPSYRENFGTNPDHARNSLTNCGIRQPEYGDRRIHYTRKKGIVTLINIMSRFGKRSETESEIKHNERLEFLGDAVVEFLSSIHLFRMFPGLAEGGLATFRASIVQNQHLAQLAKNIELEKFMLYAHGSDLCREVVMKHAMANCFEALMGALFLDAGLQVADRVFALALWYDEPNLYDVWLKERLHPLQEQEPLGDRQYIKDFEFLQKLTEFEKSIGVEFKHIRLLARAFTDRSVGFTHLTLGSNQRLEFLGDTVLQLVVSDRLYRHFPDHHEGHLSLLRSSLVNNRTQSMVCDDLDMSSYAIYNNPKAKPTTKKHKADLLEAFLGALYIDKSLEYCIGFCNACLFPRLQEFIMNQDWNDPKSKLQQCCLTLRSMEGGEPDIPLYKVIECMGPTNTRVYTVGVYFRGMRLASSRGHSIQDAEMNAAGVALSNAHELFPQLDHQKRVIAKSMRRKKKDKTKSKTRASDEPRQDDRVPKAYRLNEQEPADSSDDSTAELTEEDETVTVKYEEDSGLDSDEETLPDRLDNIEVSTLVSDMEKVRDEMIKKNQYEKLKEKANRPESEDD